MKIAILGAGFTGLAAAYRLSQKGHTVTVFEKDGKPGGLAVGYTKPEWDWTLEEHYHHWFTNDESALRLAKELDFPVLTVRPKTSIFINGVFYQLDSPLHVLKFRLISLFERFRMAGVLGFLKMNPFWKVFEKTTAHSFLAKYMGKHAYPIVWETQLSNKFGSYYKSISLAWFWARIKKRTTSLSYPEGGFLKFAEKITSELKRLRSTVCFNCEVVAIEKSKQKLSVTFKTKSGLKTDIFDAVVVTLPANVFARITPSLPQDYKNQTRNNKGLGAINVVMRLTKPFFPDNTYWLSICEHGSSAMAIVEHTNFMSSNNFNNEHLVYIGNYVSPSDRRFQQSDDVLFKSFDFLLKKINCEYQKNLIGFDVFRASFAQPIVTTDYRSKILPQRTPIEGVYLANMEQIYPWDRGTNYAVELGEKVASAIIDSVG